MTQRHRNRLIAVGVLAIAGACSWWLIQQTSPPESSNQDRSQARAAELAQSGDSVAPDSPLNSTSDQPLATQTLLTGKLTSGPPVSSGLESKWQQFSGFRMAEIQQQLMEDDVPFIDNVALTILKQQSSDGDAEAAFLIYLRYLSCAQIPSEQASFDQMMNQYVQGRANSQFDNRMNDQMDTRMANLELSFEFCQQIEGNSRLLAYQWLRTSADMNYLPAMIKFSIDAQSLFYPKLAFRQPELLVEFRNRAFDYLNQALTSGHPSAFLQYAYLYQTDTLLEPDPQQIYAYAYAAKLAGFDPTLSSYVDQMMSTAEIQLDIDEVSDARQMGRDLCERYCREGPIDSIDP